MVAIFKQYIDKESIVLEAGTHIGIHSVIIARLCKMLHGFEPLKQSNLLVRKNLRLNKIKNVVIHDQGLSDEKKTVGFACLPETNPGGSALAENPSGIPAWYTQRNDEHTTKVELTTIDSLELDRLNFIKLDVEGYELKAIKGGIKTIEKNKPVISLECLNKHQTEVETITDLENKYNILMDLGYRFQQIHGPDFLLLPSS